MSLTFKQGSSFMSYFNNNGHRSFKYVFTYDTAGKILKIINTNDLGIVFLARIKKVPKLAVVLFS